MRHTADWMVGQGVQVINYSVGSTFWGSGDGTSPYTNSPFVAVDRAVTGGIIWVNAAGNSAGGELWHGSFVDSNGDDLQEWEGADATQTISLEAQERIFVQMRWDDQWGGATKDLDLYLFDQSPSIVAAGTDPQEEERPMFPLNTLYLPPPLREITILSCPTNPVVRRPGCK